MWGMLKPILYTSVSGECTRILVAVVRTAWRHILLSASRAFEVYKGALSGNTLASIDHAVSFLKHPLSSVGLEATGGMFVKRADQLPLLLPFYN